MTIYLYVKTHNITGLKYLGKTSQDPVKYKGSGKYWLAHLKKHGNDVSTQILHTCSTNDEIKILGEMYSQLWDVSSSNEWANLKPESGDGGCDANRMKQWYGDPANKELHSRRIRESLANPSTKAAHIVNLRASLSSPEAREKRSHTSTLVQARPGQRQKVSASVKAALSNDTERERRRNQSGGTNNANHNNTVYLWVHTSGIKDQGTQYYMRITYNLPSSGLSAVARGRERSVKGWRVDSIIP